MKFLQVSLEHPLLAPLCNVSPKPQQLWVQGDLSSFTTKPPPKIVSIVGSRKNTSYGAAVATQLAYDLAKMGVIIVSGLAYGIDTFAHKGCLDADGTTIAVLGTPLDKIYPSSNYHLAQRIIEKGLILSEYPPGTTPKPHFFLERNRLVSGLADAVIIVEAAKRSGTLATATFALEQGKDLFAVPGDITRPMSIGCNRLIKHGAQVFTHLDDLLSALNLANSQSNTKLIGSNHPDENQILQLLSDGIQDGDEIMAVSNMPVANFNQAITMLEIAGRIRSLGANKWCII